MRFAFYGRVSTDGFQRCPQNGDPFGGRGCLLGVADCVLEAPPVDVQERAVEWWMPPGVDDGVAGLGSGESVVEGRVRLPGRWC